VLQSLSGLGEIVAELEKQAASREDYDPEGESNEQEIVRKRLIPHPPCLKLSLVRGNDLVIKPDHISLGLVHKVFLIAEIDGADAGKPGFDREDLCLVFFSERVKAPLILRPGAYDAHIAFQHIDKLRQFIDLCPSQDLSKGQNAEIVFDGNRAGTHAGIIVQHAGRRDRFKLLTILHLTKNRYNLRNRKQGYKHASGNLKLLI
jgi:hypothetical protein